MTVQLDTHFLASVPPGVLIEARGRVVRRTSSLLFMHGALSEAGSDVLAAQAVMKLQAARPARTAESHALAATSATFFFVLIQN